MIVHTPNHSNLDNEKGHTRLKLNLETITYFKECFKNNSKNKTTEHLKWQYFTEKSLNQNSSILVDKESDKPIAVCASKVNVFRVDKSNVQATQGLDLLVDKNHREQGLFIEVATHLKTDAEAENQAFVYSFPNGNSVNGLREHLGWKILGPVPYLIRPLKTKYFTKKTKALQFLPNINIPFIDGKSAGDPMITEKKEFPKAVDKIWAKFSKSIKVTLERDHKYLTWRYLQKPDVNYTILHAHSPDGEYLGYVIYTVSKKHDGHIGYLMELIYDPEHKGAGTALLKAAVKGIKKQNADCILSWCFEHADSYKKYQKRGFIKLPDRLRPIKIYFAVIATELGLKETVEDKENWYISYSDSDTV